MQDRVRQDETGQESDDAGALAEQVEGVVTYLRNGALTAEQAEEDLLSILECALDGEVGGPAETAGFVDHVLVVSQQLSDDPRIGRATMHDTVRSHLDRLSRRTTDVSRLDERLAGLRLGLTFDCDSEHLELVRLCREGRAEEPLLYLDSERACEVVGLAAEFEVIRALEGTVAAGEEPWQRLGQHHDAWVAAFDALAAIAWNPGNARAAEARATLLDLLSHPHTALDAAVRIQPTWLAGDGLHSALTALDRIDEWARMQPLPDPDLDSRFGAIRHAVTSLIWLAQDARRSAETHSLWGRH